MKKLIFLCVIVCTAVNVQGMDHRLTEDDSGNGVRREKTNGVDRRDPTDLAETERRIGILGKTYNLTEFRCRNLNQYQLIQCAEALAIELRLDLPSRNDKRRRAAMICWLAQINPEPLLQAVKKFGEPGVIDGRIRNGRPAKRYGVTDHE
ncbi:MAG: hypothetical protein LBB25_00185 [Holosporaceae bacterium]|jgi:hypothetical protein|nr:hypothetical protein [Holosporaceae bacterium]